jgi:hypothetical protein
MFATFIRAQFIGFFFFVAHPSIAQQPLAGNFKDTEDSIKVWFKQINQISDEQGKLLINNKIADKFNTVLKESASFAYPFDSLRFIGRLYAPNHTFRLITWNVAFTDGSQKYFGFIQMFNASTNEIKVFKLIDKSGEIVNPENSVLSAGKWYGGLYYKIIENKVDNRIYYTLLALHFHDFFTTRKVIDVLFFDNWGNPVFGAPIIQSEKLKAKHRLIFEYSAQVTMNLTYDEKLKTIVFDHLVPSDHQYTGIFNYYGPDMSFDGLTFKNGRWIWNSNLDVRRPSESAKRQSRPRPPKSTR